MLTVHPAAAEVAIRTRPGHLVTSGRGQLRGRFAGALGPIEVGVRALGCRIGAGSTDEAPVGSDDVHLPRHSSALSQLRCHRATAILKTALAIVPNALRPPMNRRLVS